MNEQEQEIYEETLRAPKKEHKQEFGSKFLMFMIAAMTTYGIVINIF